MAEHNGNVRLKDIADNLGLSIGTVQRALNNKGGYTEKTQHKVLKEAERLGYIVNTAASSLRRSPITIAVVLPVRNGRRRFFFNSVWQGILNAEKEYAVYNIKFVNYETDQDVDVFRNLLHKDNLKGIITNTQSAPQIRDILQEFQNRHIPVYTVDGDPSENLEKCNFKITVPHQGDLVAEIFKTFLHDKVGTVLIIAGSKKTQRQTRRSLDFCNAMAKNCPNASILEFHMTGNTENTKDIMKNLIESMPDLIGLYSVSALETVDMCRIIRELNRSGELVTIGTDLHSDMLTFYEDKTLLATVFQNPVLQGAQTVKLMLEHIMQPDKEQEKFIIPPSIVFSSIAADYCTSNNYN